MLYHTTIYKAGVSEYRIAVIDYSCGKRRRVIQMMEKRKFYGMQNDYMFHAVLQKNEEVLRNLLATLLEMDEADIVSCFQRIILVF